jgi:hypothetical protein
MIQEDVLGRLLGVGPGAGVAVHTGVGAREVPHHLLAGLEVADEEPARGEGAIGVYDHGAFTRTAHPLILTEEEARHAKKHPVRGQDVAMLLLHGEELVDDRTELGDVLRLNHEAHVVGAQPRVCAVVDVHAPLQRHLGHSHSLSEVLARVHAGEHDPSPVARGKLADETLDLSKQPGNGAPLIVPFVGEVEGDQELVHAG